MHMNRSWRRRLWWQHLWFVLLFLLTLGLLAWLSTRYVWSVDCTANQRHSLSATSQKLLASLALPPRISAYLQPQSPMREGVLRLLERYQRQRPDLVVQVINPDLVPAQLRERGIQRDGTLFVEYDQRSAILEAPSETSLTQTLQRLSRAPRPVFFLDGHGERKAQGIANHDLASFGRELAKLGIEAQPISTPIPDKVNALVIASPQSAVSVAEMHSILDYVRSGGHLLWLLEPGDEQRWAALATYLGINILPGTLMDAQRSALLVIGDYAPHPISAPLRSPLLLVEAAALAVATESAWTASELLFAADSSWLATAPSEPIAQQRSTPFTVALALSRAHPSGTGEQRVLVLGDGDFLSNTYLGNGANLQLGLNLFHWLLHDEAAISSSAPIASAVQLQLTPLALAWLALFFLLIIPAILCSSGWLIWRYRRRP